MVSPSPSCNTPLKPDKVRVVYDCAARYGGTSLNQQLLPGPNQTNQLVGVLTRFRQGTVGVVADFVSMCWWNPKTVMCLDFYGGLTAIYLEKWKSIECLNICSGPHVHPVIPISACRRLQSCMEGRFKQTQ